MLAKVPVVSKRGGRPWVQGEHGKVCDGMTQEHTADSCPDLIHQPDAYVNADFCAVGE
jgi:hypothetical protein